MDQLWKAEEQRLWNMMMEPGRSRRRLSLHSMEPGPERDHVQAQIDKNRERDFATGWRYYEDWIRH